MSSDSQNDWVIMIIDHKQTKDFLDDKDLVAWSERTEWGQGFRIVGLKIYEWYGHIDIEMFTCFHSGSDGQHSNPRENVENAFVYLGYSY